MNNNFRLFAGTLFGVLISLLLVGAFLVGSRGGMGPTMGSWMMSGGLFGMLLGLLLWVGILALIVALVVWILRQTKRH